MQLYFVVMETKSVIVIGVCFVLALGVTGCGVSVKSEEVTIETKTRRVDAQGELETYTCYKGLFYAVFAQSQSEPWQAGDKHTLYVLTTDGKVVKKIDLPGILNEYRYSQFYVHNDSLFLIPRKDFYSSLYLDEKRSEWQILPDYRVPLYEDDRFTVTSSCSEEWGGTVIFTDKMTGEQYEGAATCAEFVQKWDHSYYVTNYMPHLTTSMSITRIDNPVEMMPFDSLRIHKDLGWNESKSLQGMEVLLKQTEINPITLFMQRGRLMMLYLNEYNEMQIGKIADGRLHPGCSLEGLVEDCCVCTHPSSADTVQYLWFKSDAKRVSQGKNRGYGFMILTPESVKLYYLR